METAAGVFALDPEQSEAMPEGPVTVTIRPEHIELGVADTSNACLGKPRTSIYVGTHTRCKIDIGGHEIEAALRVDSPMQPEEGDEVTVRFPPHHLWAFADAPQPPKPTGD